MWVKKIEGKAVKGEEKITEKDLLPYKRRSWSLRWRVWQATALTEFGYGGSMKSKKENRCIWSSKFISYPLSLTMESFYM